MPFEQPHLKYPVIVDFDRVSFSTDKTPVVADHNTSQRIGHSLKQAVIKAGQSSIIAGRQFKGPLIVSYGIASSKSKVAKDIINDAKNEYPFQVSIGADSKLRLLQAGQKATVNGKTYEGPLYIAVQTVIREYTVTVLGADPNTQFLVAGRSSMNFEQYVKSLGFADIKSVSKAQLSKLKASYTTLVEAPLKLKKEQEQKKKVKASRTKTVEKDPPRKKIRASVSTKRFSPKKIRAAVRSGTEELRNEEVRIQKIKAFATRTGRSTKLKLKNEQEITVGQLATRAIQHDWSPEKFELQCHRYNMPRFNAPAIHMADTNINAKAIEVSILAANQVPATGKNRITGAEYGYEAYYTDEVLEASRRPQNRVSSLESLFIAQIEAAGDHYIRSQDPMVQCHRSWSKVQASGFSTLSVTNVLENVLNKAALASFQAVESVWPFITGRRSLKDFRPHALYGLDLSGSVRKVATDGELKHISMVDLKKSLQAETYGCVISIDRKTRKNDDLEMIVSKAQGIAALVGQRIEESVFVKLLSNSGSFFSTGNKNLLAAGATSALSVDSLSSAKTLFRNQVVNGKPVGVSPVILLTGTTLADLADQIWSESRLGFAPGDTGTGLKFTNNPHKGLFRPYHSAFINNTDVLDEDGKAITGQSTTQWYLFANPQAAQGAALRIGFVDGRDVPYFDEADTQFTIPGGIQMRTYLDWGVDFEIPQMALKSPGA